MYLISGESTERFKFYEILINFYFFPLVELSLHKNESTQMEYFEE